MKIGLTPLNKTHKMQNTKAATKPCFEKWLLWNMGSKFLKIICEECIYSKVADHEPAKCT